VAPKVRLWLASTDQLANDIHTAAGKPIGRVRLGILPSAAHPLVSTLCRRLQERFRSCRLSVREGQGAQLEKWLADGSVDLAILFRHTDTPRNGDVYLVETPTYPRERQRGCAHGEVNRAVRQAASTAAGPVLPSQQLARSPG
jgi:DNA-binding transcriptional LysR family regulator